MSGRYMYANLIAYYWLITLSSAALGVVSAAVPGEGKTGSAEGYAGGNYSGNDDSIYTVEIDSIAGGAEVGSATFRWKKQDILSSEPVAWEATGVSTDTDFVALDNGVQIKWVSGAGDDFAVGDSWTIIAERTYGRQRLIDGNPDTEWRTTGVSDENVVVDMDLPVNVKALVINEHNLTAGATITLEANATDAWGAPSYQQAVTHATGKICMFLDESYQYWRLRIQDAGNADGYLRMAGLFLGDYFQPDGGHRFDWQNRQEALVVDKYIGLKLKGQAARGTQRVYSLKYATLKTASKAIFLTMHAATAAAATSAALPLYFVPDHNHPSTDLIQCLIGPFAFSPRSAGGSNWVGDVELREVVRG